MFKSEKLVKITIQVPEQFISEVTGTLARFKLLHLIRIKETHLGRLGYVGQTDRDLLAEYQDLSRQIGELLNALDAPLADYEPQAVVIPEKEIFKLRERLNEVRSEVQSTVNGLARVDSELQEQRALLERLRLLPVDLDFTRLGDRKFVSWVIGFVPAQGLDKLEESLSEVHHALIEIGSLKERALVLIFGLKKDWAIFERALRGALFEIFAIPAHRVGAVGEIVPVVEKEVAALEKRVAELSEQRTALRRQFASELVILRGTVVAAEQILAARRFFGKINKSYVITGWIPNRLCDALQEKLIGIMGEQMVFEKMEPEDLREVREGIVKIPILFNNPLLISPFQKLTGLYGTPQYKEVEPTVLFALSFLLMFGMMFGDVGQGGVLFLLGYFIFRRFYRYVDYGIILMECGLFSVLFGFLYGSIFGLENIFPALWFRPMDDISYFVKVTLSLGAALVSLGMVLNLINAMRLKEFEQLLGAGGLAGALLYWMSVGLAVKYLLTGQIVPAELKLFGWATAILVTIMILHRPLYRIFIKREAPRSILNRPGFFTELMESVVEVFDDLLRFVANTVSFIRVAAFALAHTALFIAVFSMADIVSHERGAGISYWLVVAAGNIIIIVLEGLVVSIQTIRLEYYEFFGKFFRGGGEMFKPFDRGLGPEERKP